MDPNELNASASELNTSLLNTSDSVLNLSELDIYAVVKVVASVGVACFVAGGLMACVVVLWIAQKRWKAGIFASSKEKSDQSQESCNPRSKKPSNLESHSDESSNQTSHSQDPSERIYVATISRRFFNRLREIMRQGSAEDSIRWIHGLEWDEAYK